MTRSLCIWLASIALFLAPSAGRAQTYLGQPNLAPVALEARCQFAEGSRASWARLTALGADPLHVAVLQADRAAEIAPEAAESKANAAAPPNAAARSNAQWAGDQLAKAVAAVLEDLAARNKALDSLALSSDVQWACDQLEAAVAATAEDLQSAAAAPTTGCSPVIATLPQEEYLPYDLVDQHPIRLQWLPSSGPRACLVLRNSVQPGDDNPQVAVAPLQIRDFLPSDDQMRFLRELAASMKPHLPLDCWMDELIYRGSQTLAADGPVRSTLAPRNVGQQVAQLTTRAVDGITRLAEPAVPVLARAVPPAQPPAVNAVGQENLRVAADVLNSTASGLETLAGSLRAWGQSLTRVAAADARVLH